jgi:hypothetical protein
MVSGTPKHDGLGVLHIPNAPRIAVVGLKPDAVEKRAAAARTRHTAPSRRRDDGSMSHSHTAALWQPTKQWFARGHPQFDRSPVVEHLPTCEFLARQMGTVCIRGKDEIA